MKDHEEFFVGYLPKTPGEIARLISRAVVVLMIVTVLVAVTLVLGQQRFAAGVFEYGNVREFEGVIREWPMPMLVTGGASKALVAEGKHGATPIITTLEGKLVRLQGTLIYRDNLEMIEIRAGSVQVLGNAESEAAGGEDLGRHTLVGEIVDSKCYLGVMNPGHAKTHRECAALCIRGGIPPLFVARDAANHRIHLWLVSETGQPINQQVLDFVAEPIEVTGQVSRIGNQMYFKASLTTFKRQS